MAKTKYIPLTTKEALELPVWNYAIVMMYCKCKKSKAFEIIKECREKLDGKPLFNPHGVMRNSVLKYMGTTLEAELKALNTATSDEHEACALPSQSLQ